MATDEHLVLHFQYRAQLDGEGVLMWDQIAALTVVEWVQVASALGTVTAAVVAAFAAFAAFRSAKVSQMQLPEVQKQAEAANRQVVATQKQIDLLEQTRIDTLQPQTWVDLRLDEETGQILNLVVGNNGPSLARNVQVTIEPPIVPIGQLKERFEFALTRLKRGLPSLTPGRVLTWPIGPSYKIITGEDTQRYLFTLTAEGPFGPLDPIKFSIDLADLGGSMTL